MSSPKKTFDIDPDYEMNERARERIRSKENRTTEEKMAKLVEIINREFKKELVSREKQLELIQERLLLAQKALHLLRYMIVTSYYNSNELEVNTGDNSVKKDDVFSKTNRMHPAVKKLLGSNPDEYDLHLGEKPRKSAKVVNFNLKKEKTRKPAAETIVRTDSQPPREKEVKIAPRPHSSETDDYDYIRNRKKRSYCIVVGNISKFTPSESQEDRSTHKWMMYVRGPKHNPDISHLVEKIVFYLHPSYKPNDIIELRSAPFHLTRRGWGEFPVRVKIFFRCSLNKPVDVIHNLKLDQTFTGRQTLGNETVVNLHLCEENQDSISTDQPISTTSDNTFDHNYCSINNTIKATVPQETLTDHSYCQSNLYPANRIYKEERYENDCDTELKYGIPEDKREVTVQEEVILEDLNTKPIFLVKRQTPHVYQKIITADGRVLAVRKRRKPQDTLLKKIFRKNIAYKLTVQNVSREPAVESSQVGINSDRYTIDFPAHRFRNISEALPYLFKRLPLVTKLAADVNYKCTYPYAAKNLQEYASWNIGKRLSSEWSRSKTIYNILENAQFPDIKTYTTKNLILYGKSHGYTPFANYQCFENKKCPVEVTNGTTSSTNSQFKSMEPDLEVDVESHESGVNQCERLLNTATLMEINMQLPFSFVKHAALDVGVMLKPELIVPGILYNASERVLLQAALTLAENLIRKARSKLVWKGGFTEEESCIGTEEILEAIKDRANLKFLLEPEKCKCKL